MVIVSNKTLHLAHKYALWMGVSAGVRFVFRGRFFFGIQGKAFHVCLCVSLCEVKRKSEKSVFDWFCWCYRKVWIACNPKMMMMFPSNAHYVVMFRSCRILYWHTTYTDCFDLAWTSICFFMLAYCAYAFLHIGHAYGRSPNRMFWVWRKN